MSECRCSSCDIQIRKRDPFHDLCFNCYKEQLEETIKDTQEKLKRLLEKAISQISLQE